MEKETKTITKKHLFGLITKKEEYSKYIFDSIKEFLDISQNDGLKRSDSLIFRDVKVNRIAKEMGYDGVPHFAIHAAAHLCEHYTIALEDNTGLIYVRAQQGHYFYDADKWAKITCLKEEDVIDVLLMYTTEKDSIIIDLKNKSLESKVS